MPLRRVYPAFYLHVYDAASQLAIGQRRLIRRISVPRARIARRFFDFRLRPDHVRRLFLHNPRPAAIRAAVQRAVERLAKQVVAMVRPQIPRQLNRVLPRIREDERLAPAGGFRLNAQGIRHHYRERARTPRSQGDDHFPRSILASVSVVAAARTLIRKRANPFAIPAFRRVDAEHRARVLVAGGTRKRRPRRAVSVGEILAGLLDAEYHVLRIVVRVSRLSIEVVAPRPEAAVSPVRRPAREQQPALAA